MAIGTPTSLGGQSMSALSTSATHTMTTTVVADVGETIIVFVTSNTSNRTLNTVTDTAGNTYTIDKVQQDTGGVNLGNVYVCSSPVTTQLPIGGVITATFASSISSVRGLAAMKVSGLASASRVDVTVGNTSTTSGWSATAAGATSQADELLVGIGWIGSGLTGTPNTNKSGGSTYNEIFDFNGASNTLYGEWLIVSSVDTYRAAGTWSGASRWQAALVTYKQAAAGAGFTNTVPPSVSGSLSVGSTVTANPGTWTPTPSSFSYYWHRADDTAGSNLVEIGATGSTYTLAAADSGKDIRVGVIPIP